MTDVATLDPQDYSPPKSSKTLKGFAEASGDISDQLDEADLSALGMKVVEDWNRDKGSNQTWRDAAEKALKSAAQDNGSVAGDANGTGKTFPWANASDINYPILTVASQQFASRAYPAIVKGDEAVGVKVIGLPAEPPPPDAPPEVQEQYAQITQARQLKTARATRVKTWMNYHLFYGMDDWEGSIDTLLNQLPIIGAAFKKVYFDPHRGVCSDYVNALHLTVPPETQSLERCPRVTQDFELYPYEIAARQASGVFRETELPQDGDDEQAPRCVLEQHRLEDLDDDGIEEPYIVTVDEKSNAVLRIEAAYGPDDIAYAKEGGKVVHIKRWMPFVPFVFMPDPEGRFYGIGFGQLLAPMVSVINTGINQLTDAGTAAAAGGGFIGSGLRLQGAGQTTTLRFAPGEFKYVQGTGQDIRQSVWERTIPQPSQVTFDMLELMLNAAKEIASIKDVLSGNAPSTAPVGTTLALIDQGLQSFTALYKRVYRSMKAEFKAIYECQGKWGAQAEYAEVLDDPQADLKADFSQRGDDIVPVSDPSVVTRAQALAKAQVIQQVAQEFPQAINAAAAIKRIFEAAEVEEPDELIVPPPKEPPPQLVAEVEKTNSETTLNLAKANSEKADAAVKTGEAHMEGAMNAAHALGAAVPGGVPDLAGAPGQPMGVQGPQGGGGQPAGGLDGPNLGQPGGGGAIADPGAPPPQP